MAETTTHAAATHAATTHTVTDKIPVSGARWAVREVDARQVLALRQRCSLPEIVARVMAGRGVGLEEAGTFLAPSIRDTLPDPRHLKDMEKAVLRLVAALNAKEKIVVFGDYDVDGATSSALLIRYFRALGVEAGYYIPDRMTEGYGPNSRALCKLAAEGYRLCLTVDCGTLAFEPLADAAAAGLDVIVVDHHLGAGTLPEAVAVVNPNRLDEDSPCRHVAAVGVVFLLLVALSGELERQEWFAANHQNKPDLLSFLDIVALGTVCDVMPLSGLNRAFTAQGLKVLKQRKNPGLKALMDVAGVTDIPAAYHLGYVLGPRINAGGRVGQSDLGVRILSTDNAEEALGLARQLDHFNAERKAIEQQVLEQATAQIESENHSDAPVLLACGEGWHPGVIGIVASRLKERYYRPTAVIALENGIGKASARSVSGIDFGSAVVAASQSGLLLAGGGHAMAAGFTVAEHQIEALRQFLASRFEKHREVLAGRLYKADGYLSLQGMTAPLLKALAQLEPYGTGNSEPKFICRDVQLVKWDILGGSHLRCFLRDGFTGGSGQTMKAMAFRAVETALGAQLMSLSPHAVFDVLCKPKLSLWQGAERVELFIEDIAV